MSHGGKRPGAGRPKALNKKAKLQVDLELEDLRSITLKAEAIGLTLTSYMRQLIDSEVVAIGDRQQKMRCGCGKRYSHATRLHYVGEWENEQGPVKMYNCICGSTFSVQDFLDSA